MIHTSISLKYEPSSEPQVVYALASVKGVGRRFGHAVVTRAGIDARKRAGALSAEVEPRNPSSVSGYLGPFR